MGEVRWTGNQKRLRGLWGERVFTGGRKVAASRGIRTAKASRRGSTRLHPGESAL